MQRTFNLICVMFALLLLPLAAFAAGGQSSSAASAQQTAEIQQQKADKARQAAEVKKEAAEVKLQAAKVDRVKLEQQLREAQTKLQILAQRVAQLSLQLSGPEIDGDRQFRIYKRLRHFNNNQAILGITIFASGHEKKHSADGVKVTAVTPGGPAEKAGLRAGDVITAINGKSFRGDKSQTADSKLLAFMDSVVPNQKLAVSYLRDGKHRKADVTAGKLDFNKFAFEFDGPPRPPKPPRAPVPPTMVGSPIPDVPPVPHSMQKFLWYINSDDITGDMQLVPLSKDLGQYFGTDKGLLVIHADKQNELKLKDGDVILKIGGREPGSAPHAMRILRSYGPGDSLTLNIMRRGKPVRIKLKIPKSSTASNGTRGSHREYRVVTKAVRVGS